MTDGQSAETDELTMTKRVDAESNTAQPNPDDRAGKGTNHGSGGRQPIITTGRIEPLANVPFHRNGPLTRWLMASATLDPSLQTLIAIHQFSDVEPAHRDYCEVHVHDYDEINIFHSTSRLRVAMVLGPDTIEVDAPATVFIPAGTPHAANVISGTGFMVAILFDGEFRAVSALESVGQRATDLA